jgi:hypothetical protein
MIGWRIWSNFVIFVTRTMTKNIPPHRLHAAMALMGFDFLESYAESGTASEVR